MNPLNELLARTPQAAQTELRRFAVRRYAIYDGHGNWMDELAAVDGTQALAMAKRAGCVAATAAVKTE